MAGVKQMRSGVVWLAASLAVYASSVTAQAPRLDSPMDLLQVDELSETWQDPLGDWKIVGNSFASPDDEKRLASSPGDGTAVNGLEGHTNHLVSKVEHGDVQLHIEFMVPKGSNSGVYFQGRYEIQVLDSWGVTEPEHSDCGGIYQRWRDDPGIEDSERGYEGRPPRVNAAKEPGAWQSFDVVFRAPRFDENGKKTANAEFVKVEHNGIVVHENEKLSGPTRAAKFTDERPYGPLMLQGDHGPVAFRNLRREPLTD